MRDELYERQTQFADFKAGDYFDESGLLCCGKCKTRKVCLIDKAFSWFGKAGPTVVRCMCQCEIEEENREKERLARQEHQALTYRLKSVCFTDHAFYNVNLNECDKLPERIRNICQQFIDHWDENRKNNCGLLFWGNVGNGKTTAAVAIANALIEKEEIVLMRNLTSFMNATFEEKDELFRLVSEADLLIIDDFGMERDTEYGIETVFSVIDARYNSKKPIIITTNLSLKSILGPEGISQKRTYDRIQEMCVPVNFDGESLRGDIHDQKMKNFIKQGQNDLF